MKVTKITRAHGLAALQGRVMGTRAVGGLAAVTGTEGDTIVRVAELDFTGTAIEEIVDGVVQVSSEAHIGHFRNNSDTDFTDGDVVVIDSTADKSITYTTTAQDTRPVGIVQGDIAVGDTGLVAWSGDVPFVKVVSAVTTGYYAETSTTAGKATENSTIRTGSFGIFLSSGTAPAIHLFGLSGPGGDGHTHTIDQVDVEVLMQDGITAPPTPLENEGRDDWLYGTPG